MAVKVGGIYWDRSATRQANAICQEVKSVNGSWDQTDYFVDLAFPTYVADGEGSDGVAGTGIRPGMIGRKQRRFIILIEVPPLLPDRAAHANWMTEALQQSAEIVRNYLPRKAKTYPADRLADEVQSLRDRWVEYIAESA